MKKIKQLYRSINTEIERIKRIDEEMCEKCQYNENADMCFDKCERYELYDDYFSRLMSLRGIIERIILKDAEKEGEEDA